MNEKTIWDYLLSKTGNAFGTAAIMGNLMAESSMTPACASNIKKAGYDNLNMYIADSDSGKHDFAGDGIAFGLVQWCYHTRKRALLDLARSKGVSVGDLGLQLEYLWKEMSEKYKSVWTAVTGAKNVREASDVVMLKYEKPSTTTEAAKLKRANYGQKYYDQFAGGSQSQPQPDSQAASGKYVVATSNVNIRIGNGKQYKKVDVLRKGSKLKWIATSEDGWHAVPCGESVCWVSGEFSEVRKL